MDGKCKAPVGRGEPGRGVTGSPPPKTPDMVSPLCDSPLAARAAKCLGFVSPEALAVEVACRFSLEQTKEEPLLRPEEEAVQAEEALPEETKPEEALPPQQIGGKQAFALMIKMLQERGDSECISLVKRARRRRTRRSKTTSAPAAAAPAGGAK